MHRNNSGMYAVASILLLLGIVFSYWPLGALGICIATFGGFPILAVFGGAFLDIMYGTPTGALHGIYAPFTLVALMLVCVWHVVRKNLFRKDAYPTI